MTYQIEPASDADLVTFRQWNESMLSHPRLAVSTVVGRLLARIEQDRRLLAERDAEIEELKQIIIDTRNSYEAGPIRKRLTEADAVITRLRDALQEMVSCAVTFDDPRVSYVDMQVDKVTLEQARAAIEKEK